MDINKQKYIKFIRNEIKDQEKWKQEAKELLLSNKVEDLDNNSSIKRFNKKIQDLENEIENFDENSERFKIFCDKNEKLNIKNSIKNKSNDVKKTNDFDRWADVKKENSLKREYNWMQKINYSVPNYIVENLRKMPNNKGYIWKGIFHLGLLDPEQPIHIKTFFEKNNDILYIHEISPNYYKIFKKIDKSSNKELISEYIF